ncbi:MAG: sigma-70 family RNA polymerase sigma factor [Planctomycetota bacterium]
MAEELSTATSLSLLSRLRNCPDDPRTWDEFVQRYGGLLRRWCRHWGLQDADAQDVTQNVLLALSKQMRTFEYRADGRFRSWLKTIAYRAWCQFLDTRRRCGLAVSDGRIDDVLNSVEARDDLISQLDKECKRNMLEDALKLVKQRVQPQTWDAFHRTAFKGEAAATVGVALDMSVVAVYRARSRVQAMIQEEVQALDICDE